MCLAKARRFLERPENFPAGFLRLARITQQFRQVVVHLGRVGVVQKCDGPIRRQSVIAIDRDVLPHAQADGVAWEPAD